ncbi:serine/threonine protein kinase [Paenibacillus sp. N3/727]|uniref:serine/threonine protein kinase n=1 Tax=Paenibacillus sp. N3/727 TaxID=2925845 RepID=UPI001F53C099|nr:serine/threonine-protein kinase [Paenibacillus sp. N3/727]UNK20851.1 serine/threonine protein kinase [Paenibacillus sp. N3/727]
MHHPSKMERGMILGERYRIERKLGEGGMSCVYLAEDLKLPGKKWAVKESVTQPGMFQTVQAEAELLTTLSHARLPRIVDFFQPDEAGYTYMVMDYIHGMTLDKYLRGYKGHLTTDFIHQLAHQLLEVLGYLHSHQPPVVFRDLKPSNIMLTEEMEVRLIDFGIARSYKQERNEDTVKLGTVGFAAPEQYGGGQSDARSDLYGLGALFLFLTTGGKYSEWFTGVEQHIRRDISKAMLPVMRKLLQHQPELRYQSAEEVAQALRPEGTDQRSTSKARAAGTLVTAVLGTSPGVGTTHSCITIGHFLARRYSKVALVEMGTGRTAFTRIQEIAEGSSTGSDRKFSINGIDYWRQTSRGDVISVLAGGYDAVVLDLGTYRDNERLEEFLRADVPIIIGSAAEWRQHDVLTLARMLARHDQLNRVYALPLASSSAVHQLRKSLGGSKVVAIPLHRDPFEMSLEAEKAMEIIYEGFLPNKERKKRFRFAWG